MYIDLTKGTINYDDGYCEGGYCDDIGACDDIYSTTDIDAAIKSRFDGIRNVLGEDEWYYIEEYILNAPNRHSLEEILFDEDAWDDYADWKMKKFNKKTSLSASKRIQARRYLR